MSDDGALHMSLTVRDANVIEDVVGYINSGGVCEGMEGVEFSGEFLAGQYAYKAASEEDTVPGGTDKDFLEGSLEAHLEILEDAGANFDFQDAFDYACLIAKTVKEGDKASP